MKGHIRERSPGRWAIVLDIRDPATGRRKRRWHSFRGSKRAAQIECARLIAAIQGGTYLTPDKSALGAYLDQWLTYVRPRIGVRTRERYEEIVRAHLKPLLGSVQLTKLRPQQIADAYGKALANGRRDGRGGLSASTVIYLHRVLRAALAQAVRWETLTRNPADAVEPPRAVLASVKVYDLPQTAALLEAVKGRRIGIAVLLGVLVGLRRGEVCGLQWQHVDLERSEIRIMQSAEQSATGVTYKLPKNGKGRTVSLSARMLDELRQHRVRQAEELLRLGVRPTGDTFVYTREDGLPMQPRSLTHGWQMFIAGSVLPRRRFHDLRHSHATHMLAGGVHVKVASERLGHSRVDITLNTYQHVLPGMQADAAIRVDELLQSAINKRDRGVG